MPSPSDSKVNTQQIKELRERTGAGILECKNALIEAGGDPEKAFLILRAKGASIATEKAGREARQGAIGAYVHGGRIGVLVEVNCETDFVARTEEFKNLVNEVCLQIASMNPQYVTREDVPPEHISATLEQLHEQIEGADDEGAQMMQQSTMEKFYREIVLLDQPYVRDTSKSIQDLLSDTVTSVRENIVIRRFTRYLLGEKFPES